MNKPFDRIIRYSPAYTLVPSYECYNRCDYCNFRLDPGTGTLLSLVEAEEILRSPHLNGITEILILSGEVHPQSPDRHRWFQHLLDLCELSLRLGFLPHTNAGPLTQAEMVALKAVNASMGLMLEELTPTLLETVHRHAPSKDPVLRVQQLHWAGELRIPFTTGLLVGLGETWTDRRETLDAIAQLHHRWGHIQEVILQPYRLGQSQAWLGEPFDLAELPHLVAIAREHLPEDITLQIPPNLIQSPEILLDCLDAGVRDLGGIGPQDEVNPDYPQPDLEQLQTLLNSAGWNLCPRLPVYPHYESWLPERLQALVRAIAH